MSNPVAPMMTPGQLVYLSTNTPIWHQWLQGKQLSLRWSNFLAS
jgi:hypothetical protein